MNESTLPKTKQVKESFKIRKFEDSGAKSESEP